MFGVGPNRFNHQVGLIGAVDFACHTVGLVRHEVLGFREVVQPINALSVAVQQQQHCARPVLLPREQAEMIGAEVEHGRERGACPRFARGRFDPHPVGSAVEGFARRTPPVMGYRTERRLRRPADQAGGGGGFF